MGKILWTVGLAIAVLAVYTHPMTQAGIQWLGAGSADAAARIVPAQPDNGELGTFWLAGGKKVTVNLYGDSNICLRSHSNVPKRPQQWRDRQTGQWVSHSQFKASLFDAHGYDAVQYEPPMALKLERYGC